ncbi:MAG: hypothetical protein HY718_12115 [Planctomycetes bacterium]|nr:hypothetical protein [Planctomycetota bacterium]
MTTMAAPRLDHLRRLTDAQGLLHSARGEVPDRFSGYDTADNATALRLCAVGTQTVDAEVSQLLARTYYGCLSRGRRYDSGVHHRCDSTGGWTDRGDDGLIQAAVARALSAVIVSELPINLRLAAADWWRMLLEEHGRRIHTPLAAANWLIAIGTLRAADPGRDLARAEGLAHWLVQEFYQSNRATGWEWYEPQWSPVSAAIPTGLWYAYHLLGERRLLQVAQAMTEFTIENLFRDDMLQPVGTLGGWTRGGAKAAYNQMPAEVCSVVELLCAAERVSGESVYGDYAETAARWFAGRNSREVSMVNPAAGGCHDALTADGIDANQGATAIVSCFLTHAALAARRVHVEERSLFTSSPTPTGFLYVDPFV